MTLQAECGLAYCQQVLVRRAVCLVTLHTVLIHRWMLVGEWPLKLRMAAETEVVGIGQLQIVARAAAVGIVAIHAPHLGLANRVVVREGRFGILLLVASQAVLIHLPARFDGSLLAVAPI